MNSRTRKKMDRLSREQGRLYELIREIESLIGRTNDRLLQVRELDARLIDVVKDSMEAAGRIPLKIADWKAVPPRKKGDYVLWFVREHGIHVRCFRLTDAGWVNSQGMVVEPGRYSPSCYLMLPSLSPLMVGIYREKGDEYGKTDPF